MGGAGIAARRFNQAINSTSGMNSNLIYIADAPEGNTENEFQVEKSLFSGLKSSANTAFQQKIVQNSKKLVSPFELNRFPFQHPLYKEAQIVHFHSFYNFINLETLRIATRDGKKIFITLHDQRFYTGGCHHSSGCEEFRAKCLECPQVHQIFRGAIGREHQNRMKKLQTISEIKIFSPSRWLAKEAQKSSILSGRKISVIPNPIDPIFSEIGGGDLKSTFNISNKKIVLGFIAADLQSPYKGINTLRDAINRMSAREKERFSLLLVGSAKKIPNFQIPTYVMKSEDAPRTKMALNSMDLLIVPSTQDNLPNVIGEALSAGVAVAGSNAGGVPELLTDLGLPVFESGNAESLSKLISDFNYSYDASILRNYAMENLSYSAISKKLQSYYLT